MSQWKEKAIETFPELMSQFEAADTPYLLWFELFDAFKDSYSEEPRNEPLIRRIYRYSKWRATRPRGETAEDDLLTCVSVCFYEEIPRVPAAREDMPRWWRCADLEGDRNVFQYHLSDDEFSELKGYLRAQQHSFDPSLWEPDL